MTTEEKINLLKSSISDLRDLEIHAHLLVPYEVEKESVRIRENLQKILFEETGDPTDG